MKKFIFLSGIGILVGVLFASYNPWKNAAEARQIDVATNYTKQYNDLTLKLDAAKIEAQLLAIARDNKLADAKVEQDIATQEVLKDLEVQHQIDKNKQDLAARIGLSQSINNGLFFLAIAVGISFIILVLVLGYIIVHFSKARWSAVKEAPQKTASSRESKPNKSEAKTNYHLQRLQARENEIAARKKTSLPQSGQTYWPGGNGSHNYKDLPRAT